MVRVLSVPRCALAVLANVMLSATATAGQPLETGGPTVGLDGSSTFELLLDSGLVSNTTPESGIAQVFSGTITVPNAMWIRLNFDLVTLSGEIGRADASYLRIVSLADGAEQRLYAEHVPQWGSKSAYFNGNAVRVELHAAFGTGTNRVRIRTLTYGEPGFLDRSICGTTDDRTWSFDPAVARVVPSQCSAFLVDHQPAGFLTAGHCSFSGAQVVQFNVPDSTIGGSMRHPHPDHQYAVDPASLQVQSGALAVGNDWRHFGVFPNPNTGLLPMQVQQATYVTSPSVPPADGRTARVVGFGQAVLPTPLTLNFVQTLHSGPYLGGTGNRLSYQVDTSGGDSGAPVIDNSTGLAIGIHTNGGCNGEGANRGTATRNVGLRYALANPRGAASARDGLRFESPTNRPAVIAPSGGTPIAVRVLDSETRLLEPDTVTLHVLDGSTWVSVPMPAGIAGTYSGAFPALSNCGSRIRYYFSAINSVGGTDTWPIGAPANSFVALGAQSSTVYASADFQSALGWTLWGCEALTSGRFKLFRPDPTDIDMPAKDYDGSGKCLVTGPAPLEDVDSGTTRATSPVLDVSEAIDPILSFGAWVRVSEPVSRSLRVMLSSDGGASWTTIDSIAATDGWEMRAYRLLDFVPLTSMMRVRFETSDAPNIAIVEAAIDRFRIEDLSCSQSASTVRAAPAPEAVRVAHYLSLVAVGDDAADVNGDGLVDAFDLIDLLEEAGASCP